ncbi:hypothetical protein VSR82_04170 [Burkholderia sp. JPY481]|uniref:hypothetical protein n=1 Tax=Paraburkholderia sp. JPY465 TaxID=3042285 RepID=UPI00316C2B1F
MDTAAIEPQTSPPDDAEALAAARAAFWTRWRGAQPNVQARRPATLAARSEAASAPKVREQEHRAAVRGSRRRDAEAFLVRFEYLIDRELQRCESCMMPHEWREHHEWIEENARASLWAAITRRSRKGAL